MTIYNVCALSNNWKVKMMHTQPPLCYAQAF